MYKYTSINASWCNYWYYIKHEFIPPSATLIHHHLDDSNLLLWLIWKFTLQQWNTWLSPSAIHLLDCSFPVSIYSSFRTVNFNPHVTEIYQLDYSPYLVSYWWNLWTPLIPKSLRTFSPITFFSELVWYVSPVCIPFRRPINSKWFFLVNSSQYHLLFVLSWYIHVMYQLLKSPAE